MASISSKGVSATWTSAQRNTLRILDMFIKQDVMLSCRATSWGLLTESDLCEPGFYERFAYYLLHSYTIGEGVKNAGEYLDGGSPKNHLQIAINLAADKFRAVGGPSTKLFFTCLDTNSTSQQARWLRGIKQNIKREVFERAQASGAEMDKSETPLYLKSHIAPVIGAYAKVGDLEATTRRLGISTLWHSAGRASETACCTWDGIEWDPEFGAAFVEIRQSKVSKAKLIAFVSGANRHIDWFLALGDYLAQSKPSVYNSDEPAWILPTLHNTNSPGTTIGSWLRAMQPIGRGGAAKYAKFSVDALPDRVTAGGVRPGASNTLCKYMPAEMVVHVTGHELKTTSALYEYVDANRAIAIPGARVLAGWPALPWGHLGDGPVPPSLEPLHEASIPEGNLEDAIDNVFFLDSASPPMLLRTGTLRPLVRTAFASMIMYHEERRLAGEVWPVVASLTEKIGACNLINWSTLIRNKFDVDNAHLHIATGSAASDNGVASQIIAALSRNLSEIKHQVASVERKLHLNELKQHLASITAQMKQLGSTMGSTAPPVPVQQSDGTTLDSSSPAVDVASAASQSSGGHVTPASVSPVSSFSTAYGSLMPVRGSASQLSISSIDLKLPAGEFYRLCMAKGGAHPPGLSKQDKGRATTALTWFNAMATTEEKILLKPPRPGCHLADEGERRRVAFRLHALVIARLSDAYPDKTPTALKKGELTISALENRIRELGKMNPCAPLVPNEFPAWRATYEAHEAEKNKIAGSPRMSGSSSKRARGA